MQAEHLQQQCTYNSSALATAVHLQQQCTHNTNPKQQNNYDLLSKPPTDYV